MTAPAGGRETPAVGYGAGAWRQTHAPDLIRRHGLDIAGVRQLRNRTDDRALPRIMERADRLRYGRFAVGVEVLPYQIVAVLTDASGFTYGKLRRDVTEMDGDSVARAVGVVARELVETEIGIDLPSQRVAIGVQIGGPVESREGVVQSYSNHPTDLSYAIHPIHWTDPVPLAALVREETGCRAVVENDASAYAVYEQKYGIGRESESFAVILVRDGVGGGIVLDGKVMPVPFEIGHLQVVGKGRACQCGNQSCIESVAGRRAIRAIVGSIVGGGTDVEDIKGAIALANGAPRDKAEKILAVFRAGGEAIGQGIATIITMFGVRRIVIYCDSAMVDLDAPQPAVTAFFEGVETFREHAFPAYPECRVDTRPWRSTDGAHGAALVALSKFFYVPLGESERSTP